MAVNLLHITAAIAQRQNLRFTPAGVPALDLTLSHASQVQEAGGIRAVTAELRSVAFGLQAERLARQELGSVWRFGGFVANARQGKSLVFHIQEFEQD